MIPALILPWRVWPRRCFTRRAPPSRQPRSALDAGATNRYPVGESKRCVSRDSDATPCTTFTPQMEIKWGNTVNDPNNNWSGYSTCPSGYTVIGMGNV